MNRISLFLMGFFYLGSGLNSQELANSTLSSFDQKKGSFYFYWGYNRTTYSKSDIHLKADNYNFILEDVIADDLPSPFSSDYYNPTKLTIPQFNARFGFYFNEKYAIAIGWDHMKYRTRNGSKAIITGRIDQSASSIYQGYYNHDIIVMNNDELVRMEHSDGFNIVNVNVERNFWLINSKDSNLVLSSIVGAGVGLAIPWTNSKIFGVRNDDRIHFSGMGAQLYSALELGLYKRFFIRYTLQAGFANLWDIAIKPKGDQSAHAEQTIKYLEKSLVIGYRFKVF